MRIYIHFCRSSLDGSTSAIYHAPPGAIIMSTITTTIFAQIFLYKTRVARMMRYTYMASQGGIHFTARHNASSTNRDAFYMHFACLHSTTPRRLMHPQCLCKHTIKCQHTLYYLVAHKHTE